MNASFPLSPGGRAVGPGADIGGLPGSRSKSPGCVERNTLRIGHPDDVLGASPEARPGCPHWHHISLPRSDPILTLLSAEDQPRGLLTSGFDPTILATRNGLYPSATSPEVCGHNGCVCRRHRRPTIHTTTANLPRRPVPGHDRRQRRRSCRGNPPSELPWTRRPPLTSRWLPGAKRYDLSGSFRCDRSASRPPAWLFQFAEFEGPHSGRRLSGGHGGTRSAPGTWFVAHLVDVARGCTSPSGRPAAAGRRATNRIASAGLPRLVEEACPGCSSHRCHRACAAASHQVSGRRRERPSRSSSRPAAATEVHGRRQSPAIRYHASASSNRPRSRLMLPIVAAAAMSPLPASGAASTAAAPSRSPRSAQQQPPGSPPRWVTPLRSAVRKLAFRRCLSRSAFVVGDRAEIRRPAAVS